MTIRAIIVDDEPLGRAMVRRFADARPEIEVVEECSNGFDAARAVNEKKPDLVFLDVQMPRINGFEALELFDHKPELVFVTAYDHYAIKAFEVNALDYLLKPVSKDRFDAAVDKAIERLDEERDEEPSGYAIETDDRINRIVTRLNNKITVVLASRVSHIEAQDDYARIHSDDGKFLKKRTMKYYEARLDPETFVRAHRSHIVNVKRVRSVEPAETDAYRAALDDGTEIPVSKTGYRRLKEALEGLGEDRL
jgi:two-component system LytT family response regulator